MNIPLLVTILLAVLLISVDAWKAHKHKKQTNEALSELTEALLKKDFTTYESLIDKSENLGLFPRFNASHMRLEGAITKDDERRVGKILREMNVSSLVERQRGVRASAAALGYGVRFRLFERHRQFGAKNLALNCRWRSKNERRDARATVDRANKKGRRHAADDLHFNGRVDWIRTSDLSVPNRALYQAEPQPEAQKV